MDDEHFMKLVNQEAEKALKRGDYPAGCVVVRGTDVIAKASSSGITKNDPTAHAEILAISRACKKLGKRTLEGCTLYTNIEPCLMCGKAAIYAKIKRVVYGAEHKEYGSKKTFDILRQNGLGRNVEVLSGVQERVAENLLKTFLENNPEVFK